jgi:ribosomal protein L4
MDGATAKTPSRGNHQRSTSTPWQRGKVGPDRCGLGTESWLEVMVFLGVIFGLYWAGIF